jgi:hypothetical protein
MTFLLIQIVLNVILFRIVSDRFLKIYKGLSYLLYPIYIIYPILKGILIILLRWLIGPKDQTYGFAVDITSLLSIKIIGFLIAATLVQYLFNNFLVGSIRSKNRSVIG